MEFDSPQVSESHHSLLAAASAAGQDPLSLRNLLWLTNSHPKLIAHAQVYQHMLAHFDSATFQTSNLEWAESWKTEVANWISICTWMLKNKLRLSALPGLQQFDLSLDGRNPHINNGVIRHGVVAAMWNRHEDAVQYPPTPSNESDACTRYFGLQGHLLASYIDSRFRLSGLDFYEKYDSAPERPIAPMKTQEVGLAVRVFSMKKYASFIELLPLCDSTQEFSNSISTVRIKADSQDDDIAVHYMDSIRRYFDRFSRVQNGEKPTQSHRKGWGGRGGGARRHGYVNVPGPTDVLVEELRESGNDPDTPKRASQRFFVNLDEPSRADPKALEASGLSPDETMEDVLALYSPEELKGRLYSSYLQRLAIETSAQAFPFDSSQLTPTETRDIDQRARIWIDTNLIDIRQDKEARLKAIAGIITRLMLLYGQSIENAWFVRSAWIAATQPDQVIQPVGDKMTLIIEAPSHGEWQDAYVKGFCLPGIMPNYRSVLPDNLTEVDGDFATSFILPDLFGVGQQLLAFMKEDGTTDLHDFGIHSETARKVVSAFTKSFQDSRITTEKISRVLPSLVTAQTGDQTLSWILTADLRKANQPRMHYTRYSTEKLYDTYVKAGRRLSKIIEVPVAVPQRMTESNIAAVSVGARFVVSVTAVKELLQGIANYLSELPSADSNEQFFRDYHLVYVTYSHIFQSLDTSIRAITAPNDLYRIWDTRVQTNDSLYAALSDKDSRYSDRARLVAIRLPLIKQFSYYKVHVKHLPVHLHSAKFAIINSQRKNPFFVLEPDDSVRDLTPSDVEKVLKYYSATDLPANFHRAFLRTELVNRGCSAELVDAHLGHANAGESPYSFYSSFDYRLHTEKMNAVLQEIHDEIGLTPLVSQIGYQRLRRQTT